MLSIAKNKPQILSVFGLKYIRLVLDEVNPQKIESLKKDYDYIVIYVYKKPDINDFDIKEQIISIIDLSQNPNDIFKKFKKNTRNEIHKTEKIKELRFKNLDDDFNGSYKFYKKIKKRDNAIPDIKKEFLGCLFFNTYLNDKIIVSISVYDTGQVLRLKHIVSSRKKDNFDSRLAGYATRRIIWEIIKYGKKNNYKKLDLAGVNLSDPSKTGIAEFKQSFGGEIITNYICRHETKKFKFFRKIINFFGMNIN